MQLICKCNKRDAFNQTDNILYENAIIYSARDRTPQGRRFEVKHKQVSLSSWQEALSRFRHQAPLLKSDWLTQAKSLIKSHLAVRGGGLIY